MTTTQPTRTRIVIQQASVAAVDVEACAVAEAINGARQRRAAAQRQRQAAQQQRVDHLRAVAQSLRESAGLTLVSGIAGGAIGLASAGLSFHRAKVELEAAKVDGTARTMRAAEARASATAGAAPKAPASEAVEQQANSLRARAARIQASIQTMQAAANADVARLVGGFQEADRRETETRAEIAAKRADDARERDNEAQRVETSLAAQLEKLYQARQRAMLAAVR